MPNNRSRPWHWYLRAVLIGGLFWPGIWYILYRILTSCQDIGLVGGLLMSLLLSLLSLGCAHFCTVVLLRIQDRSRVPHLGIHIFGGILTLLVSLTYDPMGFCV